MSKRNWTTWIADELRLPRLPGWAIAIIAIFVVATWLPLGVIFWGRNTLSEKPRVHLIQDMDNQPRFNTQAYTVLFNDRRAMRPQTPHTVAQGQLQLDDHYYRGYETRKNDAGETEIVYFHGFPKQLEVDEQLMELGREKYDQYCYVCHGMAGGGNGPVNQRAMELAQLNPEANAWVTAKNLTDQFEGKLIYGPGVYPEGKIYNVITNGINNMAGYGHQLEVRERWAVVLYVRALQLSQAGEQMFNAGLEKDKKENE